MKVPAIIIVVGATLALAAPGGYAATERLAPESASAKIPSALAQLQHPGSIVSASTWHANLDAQVKASKALAGKKARITKAKTIKIPSALARIRHPGSVWDGPTVLIVRGVGPAVGTIPPADDCESSMVGCTPAQECLLWGANCVLVEHPSLPTVLANESSTASGQEAGQASTSSDETASTASSATDATTSTVNGPVANLIEENWDDC